MPSRRAFCAFVACVMYSLLGRRFGSSHPWHSSPVIEHERGKTIVCLIVYHSFALSLSYYFWGKKGPQRDPKFSLVGRGFQWCLVLRTTTPFTGYQPKGEKEVHDGSPPIRVGGGSRSGTCTTGNARAQSEPCDRQAGKFGSCSDGPRDREVSRPIRRCDRPHVREVGADSKLGGRPER